MSPGKTLTLAAALAAAALPAAAEPKPLSSLKHTNSLKSVPPPPSQSSAGAVLKPGQWDIAVTIDDVQIQGPMAGMASAIKGHTTHAKQCLSPTDDPQKLLQTAKGCERTKTVIANGHISAAMVCHHGATTSQVADDGPYTPTSFNVKAHAVETGGSMPMTMDMTLIGTRLGDCTG